MDPKELWKYALLIMVAAGLLVHALFPRYEWRTIGDTGALTIVVYDRWSGRFQRMVYDEKGGMNVMGVYTPF